MISIHSYELVHEESVRHDEVLLLFYDQIKGGSFFVLAPGKWTVDTVIPMLERRRYRVAPTYPTQV